MLRSGRGASMVEYIVLVVLLVGLVGGALLSVSDSIYQNISDTYTQLGS
jgi:Flp pilus assembly pilin Flp